MPHRISATGQNPSSRSVRPAATIKTAMTNRGMRARDSWIRDVAARIAPSIRSAAEAAANLTNPAWCGLVVFPESFFEGTLGEQLYSGYCISRKTKFDELLRVYFNTPIGFTEMPEFLLRLHVALEPFSISIGELIIEDTPECVIIRRSDYRHDMHSDAP